MRTQKGDRRRYVTLDTNALEDKTGNLARRITKAKRGLPLRLRSGPVSEWENKRSGVRPLKRVLPAAMVIGETPLGKGVVISEADSARYEELLRLVSSGAISSKTRGSDMPAGLWAHIRDAIQLESLARAGGGIFVTNEFRAFGRPGDPRRQAIERLCNVEIMTVNEFCAHCDALRREGDPTARQQPGART